MHPLRCPRASGAHGMGRFEMCYLARSQSRRLHAKWTSGARGRVHNVRKSCSGTQAARQTRGASAGDAPPSRNHPRTPRGPTGAPQQALRAKHASLPEEAAAQEAGIDPLSGLKHPRDLGTSTLGGSRGGRPLGVSRLSRALVSISRNLAPKTLILQSPAISRSITLVNIAD